MHIAWQCFGITIGIGAFILLLAPRPSQVGKLGKAFIALICALSVSPTVWDPFSIYYVEASSIVMMTALFGFTEWWYACRVALLPILVTAALVFLLLCRFARKSAD